MKKVLVEIKTLTQVVNDACPPGRFHQSLTRIFLRKIWLIKSSGGLFYPCTNYHIKIDNNQIEGS